METPIGKAVPSALSQRALLAAVAALIVAADLFLAWNGRYMTPYRLGFLIVALGLYGPVTRWDSPSLGLTLRPVQSFKYWIKAAVLIGVMMLALILVSLLVLTAFGKSFSPPARAPSEALTWFYFACINAPILEEVVYRFILCVPLVAICGPWCAIALSTVTFAGLHFATGVASPDNIVAGVFLAWAFLKSGSLAVPIALHALGNTCILVAEIAMWYWKG